MNAAAGGQSVTWVDAAQEAQVPEADGLFVEVEGRKIALFRADGRIWAIDDTCPHTGDGQLSLGFLDGPVIECPLHQACFDVRTGKLLEGPAASDVRSYPVRVEAGAVQVQLDGG
jgi:naphthalene 1,2-dioxygenase system ferredoxin subunit